MFLLLLVFNPTNFYFILLNTFFFFEITAWYFVNSSYFSLTKYFSLISIDNILHIRTFKFRLKTNRQHTDRNISSVEDFSEYSFNLLCPYLVSYLMVKKKILQMNVSLFFTLSFLPDVGAVSEGAVSTHEKSLPQF